MEEKDTVDYPDTIANDELDMVRNEWKLCGVESIIEGETLLATTGKHEKIVEARYQSTPYGWYKVDNINMRGAREKLAEKVGRGPRDWRRHTWGSTGPIGATGAIWGGTFSGGFTSMDDDDE